MGGIARRVSAPSADRKPEAAGFEDDDVGDDAAACGAAADADAGRAGGGVGVRIDARGPSAWSTMVKNGVSSSISPSASQGPPARDNRSTRLAFRSTIHFCSV